MFLTPAVNLHILEMDAVVCSQLLGHSQCAADLVQHSHNTVAICLSHWFYHHIPNGPAMSMHTEPHGTVHLIVRPLTHCPLLPALY